MIGYFFTAAVVLCLLLIVTLNYSPKHGKDSSSVWTPSGGSSITLNVQDHGWKEQVDLADVTYCGVPGGVQALLPGILRGDATAKLALDGDLYPWTASNLIRAGTNGVITQTVASSKAYTIPVT